jgi:hypothetical protein
MGIINEMNTTTLLITEQQETNRIAKGYELYINRLIEKLNDTEYLVNGRHIVTDYTDLGLVCRCEDSLYRGIERCKHVTAIEFYIMENGA